MNANINKRFADQARRQDRWNVIVTDCLAFFACTLLWMSAIILWWSILA